MLAAIVALIEEAGVEISGAVVTEVTVERKEVVVTISEEEEDDDMNETNDDLLVTSANTVSISTCLRLALVAVVGLLM